MDFSSRKRKKKLWSNNNIFWRNLLSSFVEVYYIYHCFNKNEPVGPHKDQICRLYDIWLHQMSFIKFIKWTFQTSACESSRLFHFCSLTQKLLETDVENLPSVRRIIFSYLVECLWDKQREYRHMVILQFWHCRKWTMIKSQSHSNRTWCAVGLYQVVMTNVIRKMSLHFIRLTSNRVVKILHCK